MWKLLSACPSRRAKKEKLLDNFLERHEAEHPFPEDVELIRDIDYMRDVRQIFLQKTVLFMGIT